MSGESCGACRFFKRRADPESDGSGWCRRFPPVVTWPCDYFPSFDAPHVGEQEWCGEFQPATPEKPQRRETA
jgi:hypothetical protein